MITTRRQSRFDACLLTGLPECLLRTILQFLNVMDIVKLAATDRWFQTYLYNECSWLWEAISFEHIPLSIRDKLTDVMLRKILIRVQANVRTRVLSLYGCEGIIGNGLTPLMNSRALEQLDLRGTSDGRILNFSTFAAINKLLSVLRSMAPHNLFWIRSDDADYDRSTSLRSVLLRQFGTFELNEAKIQQLARNRTPCCAYKISIVENPPSALLGVTQCRCTDCNRYYCKRDACDGVVIRHHDIHDSDGHAKPKYCHMCKGMYCGNCRIVQSCTRCEWWFCSECRHIETCSTCCVRACVRCCPTLECSQCGIISCNDCMHVHQCEGCNEAYCAGCQPVEHCTNFFCDKTFCNMCSKARICRQCNETFCAECCSGDCCQPCEKDPNKEYQSIQRYERLIARNKRKQVDIP